MSEVCLGFYGGLFTIISPKDNSAFDSCQKYVKCFICVDAEHPSQQFFSHVIFLSFLVEPVLSGG